MGLWLLILFCSWPMGKWNFDGFCENFCHRPKPHSSLSSIFLSFIDFWVKIRQIKCCAQFLDSKISSTNFCPKFQVLSSHFSKVDRHWPVQLALSQKSVRRQYFNPNLCLIRWYVSIKRLVIAPDYPPRIRMIFLSKKSGKMREISGTSRESPVKNIEFSPRFSAPKRHSSLFLHKF